MRKTTGVLYETITTPSLRAHMFIPFKWATCCLSLWCVSLFFVYVIFLFSFCIVPNVACFLYCSLLTAPSISLTFMLSYILNDISFAMYKLMISKDYLSHPKILSIDELLSNYAKGVQFAIDCNRSLHKLK